MAVFVNKNLSLTALMAMHAFMLCFSVITWFSLGVFYDLLAILCFVSPYFFKCRKEDVGGGGGGVLETLQFT